MMALLACATGSRWLLPAARRSCRPVSHRTSRDRPARIFARQPPPSPSNLPLLPLWSQHRQRGDRADRRRSRLARRQCFRSHDRIHARFCFAPAIYVLCVPSLPLRPYAICSLATCAGREPRIVAWWHERLAALLAGHALTPLSCDFAGTLSAGWRLTCVRAYGILRLLTHRVIAHEPG